MEHDGLLKELGSVARNRLMHGNWIEPSPYTERELQEIASKLLNIKIGNEPLYARLHERTYDGGYVQLRFQRYRDPQTIDQFAFKAVSE